jgi:hypothetical protein
VSEESYHSLALRPEVISKLRQELKRLESSPSPRAVEYASAMLAKYPGLRA